MVSARVLLDEARFGGGGQCAISDAPAICGSVGTQTLFAEGWQSKLKACILAHCHIVEHHPLQLYLRGHHTMVTSDRWGAFLGPHAKCGGGNDSYYMTILRVPHHVAVKSESCILTRIESYRDVL